MTNFLDTSLEDLDREEQNAKFFTNYFKIFNSLILLKTRLRWCRRYQPLHARNRQTTKFHWYLFLGVKNNILAVLSSSDSPSVRNLTNYTTLKQKHQIKSY